MFAKTGVCYPPQTLAYYMRFFAAGHPSPTLESVSRRLQDAHPDMQFEDDTLIKDGVPYGAIEVNLPGEELFTDERDEFLADLDDDESPGAQQVRSTLHACTGIVVVQVLGGTLDLEEVLSRFDVLWEGLDAQPGGLLQADGEGFYAGTQLIWPVDDDESGQIS